MAALRMNLQAFVDEFLEAHRLMEDVRYCWLLGAGASVSSDIAPGETFARRWLDQVYRAEKLDGESLEDFARRLPTESQLHNIDLGDFAFQSPGTHYSELYDYRFRDDPARGFAQLEDAMRGKDPGLGYAVLARFLSQTRHRVVITVNFDNLVADAVGIHTDIFPLVVGHESLANYIKLKQARPLVLKVHRDLLLDPMSRSADLERLQRQWPPLLKSIFSEYTPIVIGYDGNDRTLMRFLADHEPLGGRLYWCHMNNQLPRAEIHDLVSRHRGRLVAIEGFDELLFRLGGPLGFTDPLTAMRSRYEKRAQTYTRRLSELDEKTKVQAAAPTTAVDSQPLRDEVKRAVEEAAKEEDWWSWELKARQEEDVDQREAIYRDGIKACPKSAELADWFSIFLSIVKKDFNEAEKYSREAIDLNPLLASAPRNLANLLWMKNELVEAEKHYRLAAQLNPNDAGIIGNLALFLDRGKKDSEAEKLYLRSLELDARDVTNTSNFAQFLATQDRLAEADKLAREAWLLSGSQPSQITLEIVFIRWLLDRAHGRSGEPALGRLKTILKTEFLQLFILPFDDLLKTLRPRLPEAERDLANKLAKAVVDKDNADELEADPIWKAVAPIPVDFPWTD